MTTLRASKKKVRFANEPEIIGETGENQISSKLLFTLGIFAGIAAFSSMVWCFVIAGYLASILVLMFMNNFEQTIAIITIISGWLNMIMTYLSYGVFWIIVRTRTNAIWPHFIKGLPNHKFILYWVYIGIVYWLYHLAVFYQVWGIAKYQDGLEDPFVIFLKNCLGVSFVLLIIVSIYLVVLRWKRI